MHCTKLHAAPGLDGVKAMVEARALVDSGVKHGGEYADDIINAWAAVEHFLRVTKLAIDTARGATADTIENMRMACLAPPKARAHPSASARRVARLFLKSLSNGPSSGLKASMY